MPIDPNTNLDTFTNDHNYAGGAGEASTPGYTPNITSSGNYLITYSILDNESLLGSYYYGPGVDSKWRNNYIQAGSSSPSYNQQIENVFVEVFSANEANDSFGNLFQHVAKLDFEETYTSLGTITVGQAKQGAFGSNQGALTSIIDVNSTDPDQYGLNGDIWVNAEFPRWIIDSQNGANAITPGEWSYTVVLEEVLHSLGVDVYNNGGNSNGLPLGSGHYLNSQKYSVTSNDEHPDLYQNPSGGIEHFATELALYDVFALQQIYGANYDTRDEATTYTFGSNQAFGLSATVPFIYTIWDGGGHDLISADGYSDAVQIDLRQGRFSSIGKTGDSTGSAVAWDSGSYDAGNVSIAFGAIIEDARGSDHDDSLIGNAWDNILYGGDGNDDLYGDGVVSPDMDIGYGTAGGEYDPQHQDGPPAADNSGNDVLYGGGGIDTLYGGAGDDTFYADDVGSAALIYDNILDGGAGFDVVNYDYSAAEDAIYDFIVNTTPQDKANGNYVVDKTMNGGAPVVDGLSGIERVALAEHRANTTTKYNQQEAVVAGLSNSEYIVVWKSQSQASQTFALVFQRFDKFGEKIGSENVITSKSVTDRINYEPRVVDTGGGSFAVVWTGKTTGAQADAYAPNRWKTFVSKFDASDTVTAIDAKMVFADPNVDPMDNLKRTQEFQPDITVLSNGNLAISAEAYGDGLVDADIITQIIHGSSGDRIGANEDSAVNSSTALNQLSSEVAALSGGGYVITWVGQDSDQSGLFGRVYDDTGAPSGGQFQINNSVLTNQLGQKVTAVSDGSFIVTFASEHAGSGYDIYIRHFNANGTPRSDEILVNEHTAGSQISPDIEMLDSTRFVVVFQQDDAAVESQGSSVWGQQYDIDTITGDIIKQGTNFQINVTEAGAQIDPEIGATPDGDFAVSYVSAQLGLSPNRDDIAIRTYLTSDSFV